MAEDAERDVIFFQKVRKATGFGQIADRRVVEQEDGVLALQGLGFLQGPFDAQKFPPIGLGVAVFLVVDVARADPAVGAADGDVLVAQDGCRAVEVLHIILGVHPVQLAGTFPPVIVVAADYDFFTRQGPYLVQVFLGLLEVHSPRRVAGDEDDVVVTDAALPVGGDALPMVLPAAAEDFHGLFGGIA